MKVGFETILFGTHIDDLDAVLQTIASAGFQGVEFFQHPKNLRLRKQGTDQVDPVDIADLAMLLRKHHLAFLGLVGGTLEERIAFCAHPDEKKLKRYGLTHADCRPMYFYVKSLKEAQLEPAKCIGVKQVLHPNAFQEWESIEETLEKLGGDASSLFWIPDTAHMFIVGENPVTDIRKLPKDRVIAVHFKDWDAAYGRVSHRYAKGFTTLGNGDVPLDLTLDALKEWGWDGWLIYEQNYPNSTYHRCIGRAVQWFSDRGLMRPLTDPLPEDASNLAQRLKQAEPLLRNSYPDFISTHHRMGSAALSHCYGKMAKAIYNLFDACHVSIWSYNLTRPEMCMLAEYCPRTLKSNRPLLLQREKSPIGKDAASMQSVCISFENEAGQTILEELKWRAVAEELKAKTLLGIPIPNRYNPNQVRFVVGILLQQEPPTQWETLSWLLADLVASTIDTALDEACAYVTERTNLLANRADDLNGFLKSLHALIQKELDCQGVALFLAGRDEKRLEPRFAPDSLESRSLIGQVYNDPPDDEQHPTYQCWKKKKIYLLADTDDPTSWNSADTIPKKQYTLLLTPMLAMKSHANGKQEFTCLGVTRCRDKRPCRRPGGILSYRYFTDDDAALCNAICAAAVPHIEIWMNEEWQQEAFSLMIHELHFPLNMTKHALKALETQLNYLSPSPLSSLEPPTHERMATWVTTMQRIVGSADALGFEYDYLEPLVRYTWIMGEVIAPTVAQVRRLVERRNFDPHRIHYDDFSEIPKLWIDPNLFQQVFFNLFSNAIKYAFDAPELFRIEIHARRKDEWFLIAFRDWGPGIENQFKDVIFERGKRGPKHTSKIVPGIGMGLWIVKSIVEKHGGHVELSNSYGPTEISISLPTYLERRPQKF